MGKRILLVDDSALVRRLVREMLEGAGWEVCGEATSGAEGIRKAEQLHPDLVVLDLAMPGINGLDAARVLRAHAPEMPIVLLSNHCDVLSLELARGAGISALVSKSDAGTLLVPEARRLLEQSNRGT